MRLSLSEKYGDHYHDLHAASQLAQQVIVPSLVGLLQSRLTSEYAPRFVIARRAFCAEAIPRLLGDCLAALAMTASQGLCKSPASLVKVLDRRPNLVYNDIANDAYQSLVTRHRLAYLTKKGGKHAQLKDFGFFIGSSSQLMRWAILDLLILFICAVSWKGFGG